MPMSPAEWDALLAKREEQKKNYAAMSDAEKKAFDEEGKKIKEMIANGEI